MNRPKFEDTKRKALKDPEIKKEYAKLQPEYDLIRQLLRMRMESGLTQEEIAEMIGTKKPNISRLESPSRRHSPSLTTIKKYAVAAGYEMQISFKRIGTSKKVRRGSKATRAQS